MQPRFRAMVYVTLFSLLLLLALPALAATPNALSLTPTCTGLMSEGGSITLTRDNTATGREAFVLSAVDGAGVTVFTPATESFWVGGTVSYGTGVNYAWATPPTANPITLTIVSLAGNGLAQETVYTATGGCDGLPVGVASTPMLSAPLVSAPLGGNVAVSGSVALGGQVPVPRNNPAAVEQLAGYAIINAEALNLRSGDAPEYTVVAVVRGGERAIVRGRNEDFSWWLLEVGGVRGWASNEFIYLRGDLTDVPVLVAQGEIQPVTIVTFLVQRVYNLPQNTNRNFACLLPVGEYRVIGRTADAAYYQISATCSDGRSLSAWIEAANGALRNPAALSLAITG